MKKLKLWFNYCRKCCMYKSKMCNCRWTACVDWQKFYMPQLYEQNRKRIEELKKERGF